MHGADSLVQPELMFHDKSKDLKSYYFRILVYEKTLLVYCDYILSDYAKIKEKNLVGAL